MSLLLAIVTTANLWPLRAWPPAGARLEELHASRDHGGISERDLKQLMRWSDRWERVNPQLRKFYEQHAGTPEVGQMLWSILDDKPLPPGWAYGRVKALWRDIYGTDPPFSLVPTFAGNHNQG